MVARYERPPWWSRGRQLTASERDRLRHVLQALTEDARTLRNAVEPQTGVHGLSVGQWLSQREALTRSLDGFTAEVSRGHDPGHLRGLSLTLPELSWAPWREFGAPDPAAPFAVGAVGYRGSDIVVYWKSGEEL